MPVLLVFRFGTCYFCLLGAALVIGLVPAVLAGVGLEGPWSVLRAGLDATRPAVAAVGRLIGAHVDDIQVGSDSAFQWTAMFCLAVSAAMATAAWTARDRRRSYHRFQTLVWTFLRLMLAAAMLYFGMAKLIPTQMPFVLNRLVEPFGSFSRTGVLWAQVGVSQPYQIALGAAEVLAAALLLWRRTAVAGALVCVVDLTQVFLLNMTYDIRLKSVSSQLLLLSLFLIAPHARRLFLTVFTDRAVPSVRAAPLFTGRAARVAVVAQLCLGLILAAAFAGKGWAQYSRPAPPLYGIWQVDGFTAEGRARDPLLTDELRWRRIIIDRPFLMSDPVMVTVQHMDDSFEVFGARIDAARHFIDIDNRIERGSYKSTPTRIHLTYWFPDAAKGSNARIVIDGADYAGHRIHAWFTHQDPATFPLTSSGFHWVQQQPDNR
ncbi:DoxX family protein [Tsukamurella sp. 8F]|uniref:DoxX family protein n=1 Tax=unclassified Tsukamurella TaxID=2633480 RepID=UPI0023B946D6|nr:MULTISPECIES: DoxX family protein [unclassified Tsukamurella]MDF0531233.1 DoxX family protein [Tsukamurella sp. 8J]MDF0588502.1 DoxX family protein [Tsukamurella sp. 8F]